MKKCRGCQKPATLHVTEIRDEKVNAIHLCESCAQGYLSSSDDVAEDNEAAATVSEKLGHLVSDEQFDEIDHLVCPSCGITFAEFRSKGRLGCPQDYITFGEELMPLLDNIHGEQQHVGKVPRRAPDSSQRQYQLIRLKNELHMAVEEEEYEAAAALRDEIKTLTEELDGPSDD